MIYERVNECVFKCFSCFLSKMNFFLFDFCFFLVLCFVGCFRVANCVNFDSTK
jgi:hypothetical protein